MLSCVRDNAGWNDLVLISLGPTATVLAADVDAMGIQAIDIGQLDNEYDWYTMDAKTRVRIKDKMTAEVDSDTENYNDNVDPSFSASIVGRVY